MKNQITETTIKILEALAKSVETEVDAEWDEINSPKTEDSFNKVSDTGDHKTKEGKFSGVKDKAPAKIETEPKFDKAKDTGVKGGAQQKDPKKGPVKMKESVQKLIEAIQVLTGKQVVLSDKETK